METTCNYLANSQLSQLIQLQIENKLLKTKLAKKQLTKIAMENNAKETHVPKWIVNNIILNSHDSYDKKQNRKWKPVLIAVLYRHQH